jgi:hypothetical protein
VSQSDKDNPFRFSARGIVKSTGIGIADNDLFYSCVMGAMVMGVTLIIYTTLLSGVDGVGE